MAKLVKTELRYYYRKAKKQSAGYAEFDRECADDVLALLNGLALPATKSMEVDSINRLCAEWMINAHLPREIVGFKAAAEWIQQNFSQYRVDYRP